MIIKQQSRNPVGRFGPKRHSKANIHAKNVDVATEDSKAGGRKSTPKRAKKVNPVDPIVLCHASNV
jgi:hypothetical protein